MSSSGAAPTASSLTIVVELVVAHYHEDLRWLCSLVETVNIQLFVTVYCKGGPEVGF